MRIEQGKVNGFLKYLEYIFVGNLVIYAIIYVKKRVMYGDLISIWRASQLFTSLVNKKACKGYCRHCINICYKFIDSCLYFAVEHDVVAVIAYQCATSL